MTTQPTPTELLDRFSDLPDSETVVIAAETLVAVSDSPTVADVIRAADRLGVDAGAMTTVLAALVEY